ncbi:hypothetical protein [Nocardia amamiensis]|uniref:hypothetical protein n=1 Tax=Nocardia amamiensis TaxID=404578 RepID=UPI000A9ABBCF|nr:hypothetical protein [Nocardia amamiensis]
MTGSGGPRNENKSPRPTEADVRLSVFWHGLHVEFAACTTAAHGFVKEWSAAHYGDAVEVFPDGTEGLPRLPCERLYLE